MRNTIANFFDDLPIGIAGLAFGVCSLGWNWEVFYPLQGVVQQITAIVAVSVIVLVIVKLVISPNSFWQCQCDPSMGPLLPIIPMTIMLASLNLPAYIAQWVWGIAFFCHLVIFASFIFSRIANFSIEKLSPTWFIPTIGIAVAPLTNPNIDTQLLNQWILIIAITAYFMLLPLMIYRLVTKAPLPQANLPTLALFAAPPNLCLVGYLTLYPTPSLSFTLCLIGLGFSMTLFSYLTISKQVNNCFNPTISAFTFPLVIGAAAMHTTTEFFTYRGIDTYLINLFSGLALTQLLLATLITMFVSYRYANHYFFKPA